MTVLLRMYDDITSSTNISLGITIATTAWTVHKIIYLRQYIAPLAFTISMCAGAVLALLVNHYLVHNNEVKDDGERNNVYATFSLLVGFSQFHMYPLYNTIYSFAIHFFNFLQVKHHPTDFLYGVTCGFLTAQLLLQLKDIHQDRSVESS